MIIYRSYQIRFYFRLPCFQVLTIDASHKATDKNLQLDINYFYTSFSQVEQHKSISIATTLANKAFSYLVITIDNIVPLITN